MMGIGAVIFDFNGVLVDDEAVHFALFREVWHKKEWRSPSVTTMSAIWVTMTGDVSRRPWLDAGQSADRERLDRLIAQKARRYVEVAIQGLRFFPHAAETLRGGRCTMAGGDLLGCIAPGDRIRLAAVGPAR